MVLAAAILLSGIAFFFWLHLTIPRLDRVSAPEEALGLLVGRTMDMDHALTRASWIERVLFEGTAGDTARDRDQAIVWYRELVEASNDPTQELRLAVLEGEAGRAGDLRRRAEAWQTMKEPYPTFARLTQAAYLDPPCDSGEMTLLLAELADALPAGWFYETVALRLASRDGDQQLGAATRETQEAREETLLWKAGWLAGVEWGVAFIGLAVLVSGGAGRIHAQQLRVGSATVPPPWSGWRGTQVLLIGGAAEIVVTIAALLIEPNHPLVRLLAIPVGSLPVLLLAHRVLFVPNGLTCLKGWGIHRPVSGWSGLAVVVVALIATAFLGEVTLSWLADSANLTNHWTEWFDGDLVWGDHTTLAVSLVEYVILAPVFEELIFRGLLFATLRRRYGLGVSALMSAALFALAHGYGLVGFVSVLGSGLLWAWAYEKTGSLLPGMLAHSLNNLSVCAGLVVLLRG
jgi:membrane protease YdiL (CAAX protease family)